MIVRASFPSASTLGLGDCCGSAVGSSGTGNAIPRRHRTVDGTLRDDLDLTGRLRVDGVAFVVLYNSLLLTGGGGSSPHA